MNSDSKTLPDTGEGISRPLHKVFYDLNDGHVKPLADDTPRLYSQSQLDAAVQAAIDQESLKIVWLNNAILNGLIQPPVLHDDRTTWLYRYAPQNYRSYPTLNALVSSELPQEKP